MPSHQLEATNGTRYFLVSWDNLGVEYLEDITKYLPDEWAKSHLFSSIKEGEPIPNNPLSQTITAITLRARFNTQRHYEIYIFGAAEGITFDDIKLMTEETPQEFADLVRANYSLKLFDDRAPKKPVIF